MSAAAARLAVGNESEFRAGGAVVFVNNVAVLNQWLESDTDSQMKRTADRPIPTGKVATGSAFVLGGLMCVGALFILFVIF